jgi:hypothetical protein
MSREFITLAHYPKDDVDLILEKHTSSYGLCSECSSFSTYIPYPCPIVKEVQGE